MRVCEIHEQGIMKLKSLQIFDNEMESQKNTFLQRIHRLLASETLDLEALLSVFTKHFSNKIQEELERIKSCLVNCAMLYLDGDDDNQDKQIFGCGIQVGILQPSNFPTVFEAGRGNQEIPGETVIESPYQKSEIQLVAPIKKKINNADMHQTMKQQQNCFVFYAKKFFNLYDVLSLDKTYTSNSVSQLRLGNIDKHLYELAAKNLSISESLKEYITTATLATKSRSAQISPTSSPKRSLKNQQNYIQRLLSTSFFGTEVQTTNCISPRPKPRADLQGTMTSFSLIPQNSSLFLSSPEKDQLHQPCQTSPDKTNPSQHFGSYQISQQRTQNFDSSQKPQFLPIRLFSAACRPPNADGKREPNESSRYYENTDGVSFYLNKKPFVYISPQFPVFRSSLYPGNAPQSENSANLTYIMSKNNCRQSPFQTARKVIMVKDIDTSNPRESYLLQTSFEQKAITPMCEVQPQEYNLQVRPKGTIRLIKNPNKQQTTALLQNIDNSKQKEQQRLATPTQTIQQLQVRMKILKQQKEKSAPFRNRSDHLQAKKVSQIPITPDYYQAYSSGQYCVSQQVDPQISPRKISPGKQNKPEPQNEKTSLKTNPTDIMTPQSNSPSKRKKGVITVSSISNEIKELNSTSQLGISSQNEVFQHIISDNTQDATIFSDNKLTAQLLIQNKPCQQSQNNCSSNFKKKLHPSGLLAKNDPLNHFYSNNADNIVAQQQSISNQYQQELVFNKRPTDSFNSSNLVTSLDDMTYEQASRGRGHHQSVSSSFNIINPNKILASKSYVKVCDQSHLQSTPEVNPVNQQNKQALRNVLQVQSSKQQWQHRSFSNSGKDEKEDIGIQNQTLGQNIFPQRSSSKNILQRTTFNQSSSKGQKQQYQQFLVKSENYYKGSPEENESKIEDLNTSFSNNLDKQQQKLHSYQQQQQFQQFGESLGSSAVLRKNNFMFQAAGRKINVNLPKILKQSNKNIHRSSIGQAQVQNETSFQT